ncbi:MAG: hypothetical protein AAB152_10110 [Candidatus Coatesbacteria bacterium]
MRLILLTVVLVTARLLAGWRGAGYLSDLNTVDPGQWLDAGDRILAGSWPFRDWTGIYGPLLYAWGAGWYKLLGADWHAAALMLEAVSPAVCLVLAALVAAWALPTAGWRLLFLLAVAALGLDACYWAPALRVWLPLAGLAWATASLRHGHGLRAGLAAALCGLSPFVSPEAGLAAVAACLIALLRPVATPLAPPRRAVFVACLLAPAVAALVFAPRPTLTFIHATASLSTSANWIWGVPFPGSAYPWRRVLFLAPFALTAAALLFAGLGFLRRREQADPAGDLAHAVFAALVLRTVLGRTDIPHLLFSLPPVLVLWFRLGARLPLLPGIVSGAVVVAGAVPYAMMSVAEGQTGRLTRLALPRPATRPVMGERVAAPSAFAARLDRIVAAARPFTRPDRPVLSLPGPVFAHLLRRPNALPLAIPELLGGRAAGGPWALAVLNTAPPSVVVIDDAQCLPWDGQFVPPDSRSRPPGRLTWSTPADEAITRDLRRWLAANYSLAATVDGARIMVPRHPSRPPAELILASLAPAPAELGHLPGGDLARIPVAGLACDEIRLTVLCRYAPGLASFAKTYVRVHAVDRTGRIHGGVLPVPPASLALDLRVPVPRVPLVRIDLEVGSPGTFNPAPRIVDVPVVRLVRYTGTP